MLQRAKKLLAKAQGSRRVAIGIVGAPGSGKTHAAQKLAQSLNRDPSLAMGCNDGSKEVATVVPMDGFHYYRAELDAMPDPALAHARRGADFTFNARRFVDCVGRILDSPCGADAHAPIALPSFDHGVGDPVEGDILVHGHHRVVLVEGLYVLLQDEPWCELQHHLTEAWMLHVEPSLSLAQVVERQVQIGLSREAAAERVGNNDLANSDAVRLRSRQPHLVIDSSQAHRAALTGEEFEYAKFKARLSAQGWCLG